mgnify:CR=1 FL=1
MRLGGEVDNLLLLAHIGLILSCIFPRRKDVKLGYKASSSDGLIMASIWDNQDILKGDILEDAF